MQNTGENDDSSCCRVCSLSLSVMKRCTRCKKVFYCSRQCQIKDWPDHKVDCGKKFPETTPYSRSLINDKFTTDDGSIFGTDNSQTKTNEEPIVGGESSSETPTSGFIDFKRAALSLKTNNKETGESSGTTSEKYLQHGKFQNDVPVIDVSKPHVEIVVKANKEKHKILIQNDWNGQEILKNLSFNLKIPLDKIKIIHKGKFMTQETIQSHVSNKAVFQVIGEQAANEDGLDVRDIELMMKQLGVGRNDAVIALRKHGDIIDAMLQLGSK